MTIVDLRKRVLAENGMVSAREAAVMMRCRKEAVKALVATGQIKFTRRGNRIYIPISEVRRHIDREASVLPTAKPNMQITRRLKKNSGKANNVPSWLADDL